MRETKIIYDLTSAGLKKLKELKVGTFFVQGSIGNFPHLYQLVEKQIGADKHVVMNHSTGELQRWADTEKPKFAQVDITITVHGYTDVRVREPFGD